MKFIYTVVRDVEEAKKIGKQLVEKKLVACVNYFPISSIYRWERKISEGSEVAMFLKTKEELVEEVILKIKELHSAEVPCVVCLEITKGLPEYLQWVQEETK